MQNDPALSSERPFLATLSERALAAGTPHGVAAEAVRATSTRFPRRSDAERASRARIESYFWGVVRKRAFQGAAPAVSRRLVIASLERELHEAGHTPEAIRSELRRLYGDSACAALSCEQVA